MNGDKFIHNKMLANFWLALKKNAILIWWLFKNRAVSRSAKIIPIFILLYWLNPVDLAVPIIGLTPLDDLAVLFFGSKLFVELCPPDLVNRYRADLDYGPSIDDDYIIDAPHTLVDDDR